MKKICKFVILSTQRSGTSFLRLYLNSHPQIRCHGEIFLRKYGAKDGFPEYCKTSFGRRLLYSLRINELLLDGFFNEFFYNSSFSGPWTSMYNWHEYQPRTKLQQEKAVGFKLMYNQIEPDSLRYKKLPIPVKLIYRRINTIPILKNYLILNNFNIMHLIRKNPIRIEVSKLISRKTGVHHVVAKQNIVVKVFVDPTTIVSKCQNILDEQDKYRKYFAKNPYLEISYEEFIANKTEITRKILNFLGVDDIGTLNSPFIRTNPGRLKDIISNYDDIKQVLKNTSFEKYLYST
ncbi:MAG: sulfotransferase domain-containing protein [Candidatus Helarchaeota archaeon]